MTRAVVPLLVPLLLVSRPAVAEHDVQSRYVVLGYVQDTAGRPVPATSVELIRDKTGFSYLADTDDNGLFVLLARLGNESAGEPLTLRVGLLTMPITARFDPANHTDERGTRVDLEGTRFVERAAWFRSTLAHFLGSSTR